MDDLDNENANVDAPLPLRPLPVDFIHLPAQSRALGRPSTCTIISTSSIVGQNFSLELPDISVVTRLNMKMQQKERLVFQMLSLRSTGCWQ